MKIYVNGLLLNYLDEYNYETHNENNHDYEEGYQEKVPTEVKEEVIDLLQSLENGDEIKTCNSIKYSYEEKKYVAEIEVALNQEYTLTTEELSDEELQRLIKLTNKL